MSIDEKAADAVFRQFKHVKPRLNRAAIGLLCSTYEAAKSAAQPVELSEALLAELQRQSREERDAEYLSRSPKGRLAHWKHINVEQLAQVALAGIPKREAVEEKDLMTVAIASTAWCKYEEKKQVLMDVCRNILSCFEVRRRG